MIDPGASVYPLLQTSESRSSKGMGEVAAMVSLAVWTKTWSPVFDRVRVPVWAQAYAALIADGVLEFLLLERGER